MTDSTVEENELLINISFRMPDKNREELGKKVAILVQRVMDVAGDNVNVSMQPYSFDEDDEDTLEPAQKSQEGNGKQRDTDQEGF